MKISKILVFLPLIFTTSCNQISFHQVLAGADAMTIYFYPNKNQRDTLKVCVHRDSDVKEYMQTVSDEISEQNCPKIGKVIFHKLRAKENIASAEFSLDKSCRQIVYYYKNKRYIKQLSKNTYEMLWAYKVNFDFYDKDYRRTSTKGCQ